MDWEQLAESRVGKVPEPPSVALEIVRALARGAAQEEVHDLFLLDRELSERVLRLTGSRALVGPGTPLGGVRDALVLIGPEPLSALVLAVSFRTMFRSIGPRLRDLNMWEHAVATGICARMLATTRPTADPLGAFIAGVCHDIGKSVLDENLPDEYERVLHRVYEDGSTFFQAENEVLGFDHGDVGAFVVRRWGLPEPIEEAVRLHHCPAKARIDPGLCALVRLASGVCARAELGPVALPDLVLDDLVSAVPRGVGSDDLPLLARRLLASLSHDREILEVDLVKEVEGLLDPAEGETGGPWISGPREAG